MGSCFLTGTADWEQASEHVDWEISVGDFGLGLELLDVEGKFGSSSKQSSGSLSGTLQDEGMFVFFTGGLSVSRKCGCFLFMWLDKLVVLPWCFNILEQILHRDDILSYLVKYSFIVQAFFIFPDIYTRRSVPEMTNSVMELYIFISILVS